MLQGGVEEVLQFKHSREIQVVQYRQLEIILMSSVALGSMLWEHREVAP